MLHIRLCRAILHRDTELFGSMDPYAKITHGGAEQRSRTAKEAGKRPTWNQDFQFRLVKGSNVRIEIFD
jgi:hypothetical protein